MVTMKPRNVFVLCPLLFPIYSINRRTKHSGKVGFGDTRLLSNTDYLADANPHPLTFLVENLAGQTSPRK